MSSSESRNVAPPPLTGDDSKILTRRIEDGGADEKGGAGAGSTRRPKEVPVRTFFEIEETLAFLKSCKATKVALQFPDCLLEDSHEVHELLGKGFPSGEFFVLGDTSYGSCCVDEVAAGHVNADAIVHYGDACLTRTGSISVKYVFGQFPLPTEALVRQLESLAPEAGDGASSSDSPSLFLFSHTKYVAALEELRKRVDASAALRRRVHIASVDSEQQLPPPPSVGPSDSKGPKGTAEADGPSLIPCGYRFRGPAKQPGAGDKIVFLGPPECALLTAIRMAFNSNDILRFDGDTGHRLKAEGSAGRMLGRRFYLMSKVKEASIIGIVVGTMSVKNYLAVIQHLQKIIREAGKKSYLFLVGKINVPKLSNFAEVDLFVFVACPFQCVVDSTEYFTPIVTPLEVELALVRGREWTGQYSTDFKDILPGIGCLQTTEEHRKKPTSVDEESGVRFSMITGKVERAIGLKEGEQTSDSKEIVKASQALSKVPDASTYMLQRTFKGLDGSVRENQQPAKITDGLRGIASSYTKEIDPKSDKTTTGSGTASTTRQDRVNTKRFSGVAPRPLSAQVHENITRRVTSTEDSEDGDEDEDEEEDEEEDDEDDDEELTMEQRIERQFAGMARNKS